MKTILIVLLSLIFTQNILAQSRHKTKQIAPSASYISDTSTSYIINGIDYSQYKVCVNCGDNWREINHIDNSPSATYNSPSYNSSNPNPYSLKTQAKYMVNSELTRTTSTFFGAIGEVMAIGTMKAVTYLFH